VEPDSGSDIPGLLSGSSDSDRKPERARSPDKEVAPAEPDPATLRQNELDAPRLSSIGRGRDIARLGAVDNDEVSPPERGLRTSKQEKVQAALELGWGPYERQTSFLTKCADDVQAKNRECFT
jgi:hypothetical protein